MDHRNDDLIVACPECDSSGVKCNVCTDLQGPNHSDTAKHRCEDCGHRFPDHEAIRRERKIDIPPRSDSLARTLYDADPDDLATDGGSVHGEDDETGRPSGDGTDRILYLTTLRCQECGNRTTYAHEGPRVPLDQDAPWPDDVQLCPECGTYYPDDLGVVTWEVANAERVDPYDTGGELDAR